MGKSIIYNNPSGDKALENVYKKLQKDPSFKPVDTLNLNTLALNWNFDNVTTSDSDGAFSVTDISSGSATLRNNYGWIGKISGYQHTGYGNKFNESSRSNRTKRILIFYVTVSTTSY